MMIALANNAQTVLLHAINASDTSLTLINGAGSLFPHLVLDEVFYGALSDNAGNVEYVKVTKTNGDVFTVVRGQERTAARSWASGSRFQLRMTAETWKQMTNLHWERLRDDVSLEAIAPAVTSSTAFRVAGDHTAVFQQTRAYRLYKSAGGFDYGFVADSAFANSVTTVTVNASSALSGPYLCVDLGIDLNLVPEAGTAAPAAHLIDANAHAALFASVQQQLDALSARIAALEARKFVLYS